MIKKIFNTKNNQADYYFIIMKKLVSRAFSHAISEVSSSFHMNTLNDIKMIFNQKALLFS